MKRKTKIILALIIGFVVAMIAMSIAIYFGYASAYKHMQDAVTVKVEEVSTMDDFDSFMNVTRQIQNHMNGSMS